MMIRRIMTTAAVTAAIFAITACSGKKQGSAAEAKGYVEAAESQKEIPPEAFEEHITDADNFFKLDYAPYEPEPEIPNGRVFSNGAAGGGSKTVLAEERKLSEYIIKYSDKAPELSENNGFSKLTENSSDSTASAAGVQDSAAPFTVLDWGPGSSVPADVHNPNFYVLFSEPVVAMSKIGSENGTSGIMQISPALPGTFRWNGTSLLCFECTGAADPATEYTITVSDKVKSITGKSLSGQKEFKTKAAPLSVKWSRAGYSAQEYIDQENVPPKYANEFRVCFDYPVNAARLQEISEITILVIAGQKEQKAKFTVEQNSVDTVTYRIADNVPMNAFVFLKVQNNGEEPATASFETVGLFSYNFHNEEYTSGKKTNPVRIAFTQPVDGSSALSALRTEPAMPITDENIEVYGNSVSLYGLPVTFGEKYSIIINKNLKDIYGQSLSSEKKIEITVPNAQATARFNNYGAKMLEAQFPHRLVFEYQNAIEPSYYVINSTDAPLYGSSWESIQKSDEKNFLNTEEKNRRILTAVDFDQYLTNGRGAVSFGAELTFPRKPTKWDDRKTFTIDNTTTIQVTDIGITTRFAVNKIVVLASSLSTGAPLNGADVYAFASSKFRTIKNIQEKTSFRGKTDERGLAVIEVPQENIRDLLSGYGGDIAVAVHYKEGDLDDWAVYEPESHYPWRSGVYTGSVTEAYAKQTRVFMFSDRGLYKPGETLSLRGIDRTQQLGVFKPYQGKYTITLESDNWRDDTIYAELDGEASESGGFFGSIELPDDMEPGSYSLKYKRAGSKYADKSVTVNVAYFERVKFQTGVSMPKTNITMGEKIQSSLSASYLAGGALSAADYEADWFREPCYWSSAEPEFKGYTFGPKDISENRQLVTSQSGKLDGTGKAVVGCETSGAGIKGTPYSYRVNASITDVSNQAIGANGYVTVHPASYYIGLSKPLGVSSFPKTGEKIKFNFAIADLDGKSVRDAKSAALLSGGGKKISVQLLRVEWNLVQQQGVSENIYSRYEKTLVTEDEFTKDFAPSGEISISCKKPGYHVLHLSCTDSLGRDAITEYEFYATGSGAASWYSEDADSIELTPDQNMYKPGETARILMQSTLPKGDYLITVEREGIFTEEVRHFDEGVQVLEIPVARNFIPVVYVSVASYSVRTGAPKNEYGTVDLDKPKGFYGVTRLSVNPRVKTFSVDIATDKKAYKSGEEVEVTLKATKGGKPLADAELTLMAVDRGVLDLINYHVPDPIKFFYSESHFPLRVRGGDSRALLMDPVTYEVKNLAGGDAESSGDDKINERKDFNPTAVFEPVLKTDKNGEVKCRFKLPDSLTTYRLTAFGVQGELLALHEDEIIVQNPINVQQVLPRRLRERDTAEMGVLITNLDSKKHEMNISLALESPAASEIKEEGGITLNAGGAKVDGKSEKKISIEPGENAVVYFNAAAIKAGTINAVWTIRSDAVNERVICPLVIEKPYIYETFTSTGQISQKEKDASVLEQIILPEVPDNKGSLTLTLDATRLGLLGDAVNYVFYYPYGCMEQQSSRILPLIIFEKYISLFNMESQVSNVKKCVTGYFKDWKSAQHSDGSFGYWPSSYQGDIYVSLRIAHIAAIAKAHGYSDSQIAFDYRKLLSYTARGISGRSIYLRAYYYYIRSLFGESVPSSELESIYADKDSGISELSFAGLAALNVENRNEAFAKKCAAKIKTYIRPTTQGVDISSSTEKSIWSYYNDNSEMLALSLSLFDLLDRDDEMCTRILHTLLQNQSCGYWKNTSTTARVLESIAGVIKNNNLDATKLTALAKLDGKEILKGSFKGAAAKPVSSVLNFDSAELAKLPRDKILPLGFEKQGRGALYYTATLRYAIPQEEQASRERGLSTMMSIYDNATGEEIRAKEGSNLIELQSGKTYRVRVHLSSTYDRTYIAMRAPVPSGAEILDATFVTTPTENDNASGHGKYSDDSEYDSYYGSGHWMSNQAIYDNEIQFFWDYFNKGKTDAEFKFRASRRGVYPTPPVTAECMYEPEVFGRTGGLLYVIK